MNFSELYLKAQAAGAAAGEAAKPRPIVVGQAVSLFAEGIDYLKPVHYEAEGVCGFARVIVKPGNSAFARYLLGAGLARKCFEGGVRISISDYGQSLARKEAHADAMAKVFSDAGIRAYADARID